MYTDGYEPTGGSSGNQKEAENYFNVQEKETIWGQFLKGKNKKIAYQRKLPPHSQPLTSTYEIQNVNLVKNGGWTSALGIEVQKNNLDPTEMISSPITRLNKRRDDSQKTDLTPVAPMKLTKKDYSKDCTNSKTFLIK